MGYGGSLENVSSLIDQIVLNPIDRNGRKTFSVDLHGDITGILSMAAQMQKPSQREGLTRDSMKLVVGPGIV